MDIKGEGREGGDANMEVKERVRDMQICVWREGKEREHVDMEGRERTHVYNVCIHLPVLLALGGYTVNIQGSR